jgi:hypothetical protein
VRVLDALFSCRHKKLSFPITVRGARHRVRAASLTGTYVVCLDCGHEIPYDWNDMKVIREASPPQRLIARVIYRA